MGETISKRAVPRVSWEVRRRRFGDNRWLVRNTEFFAIDAITDTVWLACAEGLDVEGIVHKVAAEHGLTVEAAVERTSLALRSFSDAGLVTFSAPPPA